MASYTPVSVSSYNSSPPADDGTEVEANRVKWSTIKTKLSDPLNTAIGTLDDNIAAAITTITSGLTTATTNAATHTATYATRLVRLHAPANTAALFVQSAAPTLWTKSATHSNKALRVVSGTASSGGTRSFTSTFTTRTLVEANLPAHTHSWSSGTITCTINDKTFLTDVNIDGHISLANGSDENRVTSVSTDNDTIAASASIASTSTGTSGSDSGINFSILYCDVIVAIKD